MNALRRLWTRVRPYGPALGMVAAAVLATLYTALGDNVLTVNEMLTVAASTFGAITTYLVPRAADAQWLKIGASAGTAAVVAAIAAFGDQSWSAQDTVTVASQLIVGLGITVATNPYTPRHAALADAA